MSEFPASQSAASVALRLSNWSRDDSRSFVYFLHTRMAALGEPVKMSMWDKNPYCGKMTPGQLREQASSMPDSGRRTKYDVWPIEEKAYNDTLVKFLGPTFAPETALQLMTLMGEAPYDLSDTVPGSEQPYTDIQTVASNIVTQTPDDMDDQSLKPLGARSAMFEPGA